MTTLESFDAQVKELASSGKLSASKVKSITDAAMANIESDAHLVATLFKCHKQAKGSHKISTLYVIDAVAREARSVIKKGKDRAPGAASDTPTQTHSPFPDEEGYTRSKGGASSGSSSSKGKGNCASFLAKIEVFLDRLLGEVLTKGPAEHKEKVKKVLDIWNKTSTFSSEAIKSAYARLNGETHAAVALASTSKGKIAER